MAVHPRVCGEHGILQPPIAVSGGSSPRMRGTRSGRRLHRRCNRFIPAYAGNTRKWTRLKAGHSGSSPRMRGTLKGANGRLAFTRFIPAYAGNTSGFRFRISFHAVHPRVCGEHSAPCPSRSAPGGSSPRMRGTHEPLQFLRRVQRFIPAYAGNTYGEATGEREGAVHPRVCGEHPYTPRHAISRNGSSPRMRGTRLAGGENPKGNRFIPAYAGNTKDFSRRFLQQSVHPRVCGEH